MLQTVKLKHFLNKWNVSSNLDFFFVLFVLTRTQGSSTCGFYLNNFYLHILFYFFSLQHHYANIPSKLGSRHTDVKGLLRVFFSNEGSVPLSGKYNVKIMKRMRSYTTSTAPFRMIKKIYPDFDSFQMIVNKIGSWSVLITPIGGFFILLYDWGIIEDFYPM